MRRVVEALKRADAAVVRVETVGVVVALSLMVGLKFVDVVLRNVGKGGVPEFATVAQHLVLWVGMLGASLATYDRKHISIEVIGPFLPARAKRVVDGLVDVAAMAFSIFLAYVAWRWLAFFEMTEPRLLFHIPLWGKPFQHWWSLAIIPVGFAMIGLRFGRLALERAFLDGPPDAEAEVRP